MTPEIDIITPKGSGVYKTNSDIGFPAKKFFSEEVNKYCFMWKDGGQYSKMKTIKETFDPYRILNPGKVF